MASARTAAVNWWPGRSESSRKDSRVTGGWNACLRTQFPGCRATNGAINFSRPGTEVERVRVLEKGICGRRYRLSPPLGEGTMPPAAGTDHPPWDVQPVPLWNGRHDEAERVCGQVERRHHGAVGSKDPQLVTMSEEIDGLPIGRNPNRIK